MRSVPEFAAGVLPLGTEADIDNLGVVNNVDGLVTVLGNVIITRAIVLYEHMIDGMLQDILNMFPNQGNSR